VHVVRNRHCLEQHKVVWQKAVHSEHKLGAVHGFRYFKVRHIVPRVNPGIGSAHPDYSHVGTEPLTKRRFKHSLDGSALGLALPT
jgi:hypothetical protein